MVWIVWLLLCCGPPVIMHLKGRSPLQPLLVAVALSSGLFLVGWGFMSLTGASRFMATTAGQVLGAIGLITSYGLAFMSTSAEAGRVRRQRKQKLKQCPNCAGFIEKGWRTCRGCGQSVTF